MALFQLALWFIWPQKGFSTFSLKKEWPAWFWKSLVASPDGYSLGTTMAFRKSWVQACPCLSWKSYFDTTSQPHAELRTMALLRNQPPGVPITQELLLPPFLLWTMEPQVFKAESPGDRRQASRQCDGTFPFRTPDSASVWPSHLWERTRGSSASFHCSKLGQRLWHFAMCNGSARRKYKCACLPNIRVV